MVSPSVSVQSLLFSVSFSHNYVRLHGNSDLDKGVHVSVNGSLSFCVSPMIDWRLVKGVHLALRQLGQARDPKEDQQ